MDIDKPYNHKSPIESRSSQVVGKRTIDLSVKEDSIKIITYELGKIALFWPKIEEPEFETRSCFPEGYYKNSEKEKILLAYAENFRRQFLLENPKRKHILFQAVNDCGLNKMVCTTIRPTFLPYPELRSWEGCASFVADYIKYEPLEKQFVLPERILSPFTVMKRHRGNNFEMATVLVSLLIGVNIDAFVVIGSATRNICLGIEDRSECPELLKTREDVLTCSDIISTKYVVKERPSFESKHLTQREQKRKARKQALIDEQNLKNKQIIEELENPAHDDLFEWRIHAWVLILQESKTVNKKHSFFIEPSNGQKYQINSKDHFMIQSVYNDKNYYINLQSETKNFDLNNGQDWLPLLNTSENTEKKLDMPSSWVEQLEVSNVDYEKRYPNGSKLVKYKKVILEKFAPFFNKNGLVQRISKYNNYNYTDLMFTTECYDKRDDYLIKMNFDYKSQEITEFFSKGRSDHLMIHIYEMKNNSEDAKINTKLIFYNELITNNLQYLEIKNNTLTECYINREDKLYLRETICQDLKKNHFRKITEYYKRNNNIQADEDISEKIYDLEADSITVKFHFKEDFITKSYISWKNINLIETNSEYEMEKVCIYMADSDTNMIRPTKLVRMLKYLMVKKPIKDIQHILFTLEEFLKRRMNEKLNVKYLMSIFDTDKNEQIKYEYETLHALEKMLKEREIDGSLNKEELYLSKRDAIQLTAEEKLACLKKLKERNLAKENKIKEQHDKCLQDLNELTIKGTSSYKINEIEKKLWFLEKHMQRQEKKSKEAYDELKKILDRILEE